MADDVSTNSEGSNATEAIQPAEHTQETGKTVQVELASDEDLNAFLEQSKNTESENTAKHETQKEAPVATKQPEKREAEPKAEQSTDSGDDRDREIARLREAIEAQRVWDARRSTELGETRKQLKEARQKLNEGIDAKFIDKPSEAMADQRKIDKIDQHLEAIDGEESQMHFQRQSVEVVSRYVDPKDFDINAMVSSLKDDGFDQGFIEKFQKNPFIAALPETLVQMAKRGKAENALRILAPAYRDLAKENEELKKQLKVKPSEVAGRINEALKSQPSVTAKNGGSSGTKDDTSNVPVALMSDSQLDAILSRAH